MRDVCKYFRFPPTLRASPRRLRRCAACALPSGGPRRGVGAGGAAGPSVIGSRHWCARVCDCPRIHLYEVEYKLEGMIVVPTHKNCGASLNDKQADKFQKELVKSWGFEDEDDDDD